ncbi:MAG TPA: SDR family NAD(P)-dependent oxidoreductase [Thermomicrobiaceae bacterium]|nr:SDR family NAD(P)-dependent oxidoreductase [Thermomicrobiaceae bacterium]
MRDVSGVGAGAQTADRVAQPAVVITGAGSGIGAACAVALSNAGYRVFAGVRREPGADAWQGGRLELITPLMLEVTDTGSIARAAAEVEAALGDAGLAGLVNCAGIALGGPLEFLAPGELRRQLDVNVVGQLAVTQAFLPLIRRGRGRLVNVGSVSGRNALPFLGPYAASKFALRALNDALRVELRPWGIPVILIEPGSIATGIWARGGAEAKRQFAAFPPDARRLYGKQLDTLTARVVEMGQHGLPAQRVAETVALALSVRHPQAHYAVAPAGRRWMSRLLSALPTGLRDRLVLRALR